MMKNILRAVFCLSLLLLGSNANALHGNPSYYGTVDYCFTSFCNLYDSLESGSNISSSFNFELLEPFPELGQIFDYNIILSGSTNSITLDSSNTSIILNTANAYADEFENTTISGGIFALDTSAAFTEALGLNSELWFDFNQNRIDFYAGSKTLIASTSPVPAPSALILFFSGIISLFAFAKKRHA